jgi:hypothetical protein
MKAITFMRDDGINKELLSSPAAVHEDRDDV